MNRKLAKIIKNLNEKTRNLAIKILESPIKWDLINFFYSNPFSIHTARGLANMIGRRVEQVFKEAEELTELQVLKRICENGDVSSIYAYEPEPENSSLLNALVDLDNEDHDLIEELLRILKEEQTS